MRVSVIGGADATDRECERAETVGRLLAERGATLVCGGRGGVMEAACRGATERGGHTIGILPGEDPAEANPHVDTSILTGIGHARNALVVLNGDAVVAIDGGGGTLSEFGFAAVYDRPVAAVVGSNRSTAGESRSTDALVDVDHVVPVETPADAVEYVAAQIE